MQRLKITPTFAFDVCHETYANIIGESGGIPLVDPTKVPSDHLWRSHKAPTGQEYAADFTIACRRALEGPKNAPRLILCKLYYLELAPYEKVRRQIGIGELIWSRWTEDIRNRVGVLLLEKGIFPPRQYFGERGRPSRNKIIKIA